MFEVQMLIPLADNQANAFTNDHHDQFEAQVLARFGGVTRYRGEVAGSWQEAGITYRDSHRVYGIALRSITQGALIGEVAAFARTHYRQEAIYIRYLGVAEIL